ncbi:hypothetical protein [Rhodococcus pseudokoreensis]|uniref:hypothetical protein n=1 Tax=Rhodococcus pseudokoreensis TaxID=2811421 RepID=UPI001F1271F8|nr:hypothetical protein [Rhodococcus pseudokoreensis]
MTPFVTYRGKVSVLDLGDDENRFSLPWVDTVDRILRDADRGRTHALVTTATGKFYSNGLDLEWLSKHSDRLTWYVDRVQALLSKLLTLSVPDVAAIDGHAIRSWGDARDRTRLPSYARGPRIPLLLRSGNRHPLHHRNRRSDAGEALPADSCHRDDDRPSLRHLFTGVHGNYLRGSIEAAGLDPNNLAVADPTAMDFGVGEDADTSTRTEAKPWRDIWGAGQGIGAIDAIVPAAQIVERLSREYTDARAHLL